MKWMIMALLCMSVVAQDEARWIHHYTRDGGGFETTINLVNSSFDSSYAVQLTPYGSDGTQLSQAAISFEISPGSRLQLRRSDLNWEDQPVSHLMINGDEAVRVSASFQAATPGAMAAEVNAAQTAVTSARFLPVEGVAWFDGLVVVNPAAESAAITLSALDADGNTLKSMGYDIPAGGKWLDITTSVFADMDLAGGQIRLLSDTPVHVMGLRGSLGQADLPVLTQLSLDTFNAPVAKLTWHNQVSRIVERNCNGCHRPNGIGPFALTTHEETAPLADAIAYEVGAGNMPPWQASDKCEPVSGSRALEPVEKEMLLAWIRDGAEAGDPQRAMEPVDYGDSEWKLGEPDLEINYGEPYVFEAGPDQYRCFPVTLDNTEPVTVRAIDILPDNDAIVHHVLVFSEDNSLPHDLDSMEDGPGYTCFGGPGTGNFRLIGGWAPGMEPQIFSEDTGMTLQPGSLIVFQVHYNYSFTAGGDQTKVGLYLTEEPRDNELILLPVVEQDFLIPAGAKDFPVSVEFEIPDFVEMKLHTSMPHMHLLGTSISLEVEAKDGSTRCMIDIPKWDFDWQQFYQYPEPLTVSGGSIVRMHATYDNSSDNPFNPNNPPIDVGWGEETSDEMALVFVGVTSPVFNGKKPAWEWPFHIQGGITPPDVVKRSLEKKRAVKDCCNPLGAKLKGTVCPSSELRNKP